MRLDIHRIQSFAATRLEVRRIRKILEDIYCGRFSAINRPIRRGPEYDRAISEVTRCEKALRGKLNPEEVKLLRTYSQACADLSGISSIENFVLGFRMGAQLMLAILEPDNHESEDTGERLGES